MHLTNPNTSAPYDRSSSIGVPRRGAQNDDLNWLEMLPDAERLGPVGIVGAGPVFRPANSITRR